MQFMVRKVGNLELDLENLMFESELKPQSKVLLLYLNAQTNLQYINTDEWVAKNDKMNMYELLFDLQLHGYIKAEDGMVELNKDQREVFKRCHMCDKRKNVKHFSASTSGTQGLHNYCKPCHKIWRDEYNANRDKDERRQYDRNYKARRKEEAMSNVFERADAERQGLQIMVDNHGMVQSVKDIAEEKGVKNVTPELTGWDASKYATESESECMRFTIEMNKSATFIAQYLGIKPHQVNYIRKKYGWSGESGRKCDGGGIRLR